MALSDDARNRLFISVTDKTIGTEIADAIDAAATADDTALYHEVMAATSFVGSQAPKTPTATVSGTTFGYSFTVNTDEAYRNIKVGLDYSDSATFHVHWTKSTDVSEAGKAVKWRISYTCTNGNGQDVTGTPAVVDLEDTYDDSGTTTRIVYRTAFSPVLTDIVAGYYLGVKVEAITPAGVALAHEPVLVGVDFRYNRFINR